jgi:hypothetical protein
MSTNDESVQDFAGEAGTSWWLPVIAAVATFMTAIAFAWSKDFAVFLLLIFVYLPAAAFTCIGLFVWAVIKRNSRHGRAIFMAFLAVPLAMGLTFYLVPRFKDEIRFLVWSHIHGNKLSEYANTDAIILDWEDWGLAGMENDSYLVSNPADNLGERGAAYEWTRHIGSTCDIVATKRMAPALYIVTTFNCPLR